MRIADEDFNDTLNLDGDVTLDNFHGRSSDDDLMKEAVNKPLPILE